MFTVADEDIYVGLYHVGTGRLTILASESLQKIVALRR